MATDIIIHDKKDNVGVVVIEKITPKQDCKCWIMENDSSASIQSIDEIPLGHKIAMVDLKEGDTILKYGHDIVISFLEPIGPGKDKNVFINDLEAKIYSSIDSLN